MHLKEASRHLPDLWRRLLALLAALPDVVVVPEPALVELALAALGPHLDLDRRRPRDALRVARVAVAEHHPESQTTAHGLNLVDITVVGYIPRVGEEIFPNMVVEIA